MKEVKKASQAGYRLESVYAIKQAYEVVPTSDDTPDEDADLGFGWDWRFAGEDVFEVAITISIGPSKARPETVELSLVGAFCYGESTDAHSIDLRKFVRVNAVTTLIIFAREIVASVSSRGPYGPLYLPHLIVFDLMKEFDPAAATGMQMLRQDPELRRRFGVEEILETEVEEEQKATQV